MTKDEKREVISEEIRINIRDDIREGIKEEHSHPTINEESEAEHSDSKEDSTSFPSRLIISLLTAGLFVLLFYFFIPSFIAIKKKQ